MQQGNVDQAEMHLAAVVANQPDDAGAQSLLAEVRASWATTGRNLGELENRLEQPATIRRCWRRRAA